MKTLPTGQSNLRLRVIEGRSRLHGHNRHSTIVNQQFLVLAQRFVEGFGGLLGDAASFGNLPLHLAGADFILRDAARLAGISVHHRRCARLELPRTPRRYQYVPVVAVEAFNQLHLGSPSMIKSAVESVSSVRRM